MPPNRHAVLSASSSHRWLHCNPSARLELEFEDRETEAAAEGTAAHALAEHKLRKALKIMLVDNYLVFYVPTHDDTTVTVMRIMYGGRDIDRQLEMLETE